jgi:CMP/dCMP kinase
VFFEKRVGGGVIVTIDGPAGAGKSSVAKRLAQEIGFHFLDTGAMYRCVTFACLRQQLPLTQFEEVATIARSIQIEFRGTLVFMDGEDVSQEIRRPTITKSIRPIADNPSVREAMVALQRRWTEGRNVVTEGRDQGTVAFPNAECKIFLTASPEERARRRVGQLIELGMDADYQEILEQQNQRDSHDTNRPSGGLKVAPDSVTVCTDGMSEVQVLQSLIEIVQRKQEEVSPRMAADLR